MSTPTRPTFDIPCKRPRVTITRDQSGDMHVAVCSTGTCDWSYGPALKSDAETHARWHRAAHRAAVPHVEHGTYINDGRKVDQCECGWVTPVGFTTAMDRGRKTVEHLANVHGLVS